MTPTEYMALTRVTDHKSYQEVQDRLAQELNAKLLHYTIGIATESGEFLDAMKKAMFYGKSLDMVNLKEEIGDILWYIARACDTLGVTMEELMETNIKKLQARYGDKFTMEAALNRDLAKEREILEASKAITIENMANKAIICDSWEK